MTCYFPATRQEVIEVLVAVSAGEETPETYDNVNDKELELLFYRVFGDCVTIENDGR